MKLWLKENWFRIIAIVFLLGALGDWEYGYYQLLRWVVCVAGVYSAYLISKQHKGAWVWIFGAIAILFNPILPIYLSRSTWQVLDIAAAATFFISLFARGRTKIENS